METVTVKTNIDNYTYRYPHYADSFNEFEKLFWVIGQEIQSLKYLHKLYIDSYSVLEKQYHLVTEEEATRHGFSESGHKLGLFNLIPSFAPEKGFQTSAELAFYWRLLFLSSVTPEGMKNFIKFVVAHYIVQRNIDIVYLNTSVSNSEMKRIDALLPDINVFIYEWSSSQEIQIGSYYFFPGGLPFMSVHILVGMQQELLTHVNSAELLHHLYNQLQDYKVSKLTPTLNVETLNIIEAWENG